MANKPKFKIGDRVIHIGTPVFHVRGVGTITSCPYPLSNSHYYSVEGFEFSKSAMNIWESQLILATELMELLYA